MDYMEAHGTRRSRPAELVPDTVRVISVRMNYAPVAARDAEGIADAVLFGASLDHVSLASTDHAFELIPTGGPVADPEAVQRQEMLLGGMRLPAVRRVVSNAGPAILGRGAVQVMAYVDLVLASTLATGAVAALGYAQVLYILPVSLFAMSVSAAELPELSRISREQLHAFLGRVERSVRQVLFLTIPTVIGYLGLGFLLVGAFFRRGNFGLGGTWLVYLLLGGYTLGMLATTVSRLLQNSFYALHDTRTPGQSVQLE